MSKAKTQGFDISKNSAAVIGCGGLGCNVAVHLAGAGIGKLKLIDFDTVSESNLNRQFLYAVSDYGKPKAETAAAKLKNYAPDIEITAVNQKITDGSVPQILKDCDIIFLAVDNNAVRSVMQGFCAEHNIALVNGGISCFVGNAYLYIPHKTPCLDCAGLTGKETENIFSVSTTAGIIGALQAELGIKFLLGSTDEAGILHIYDNGEINKLKIKPQVDCGCCGVNKNV